MPQTIDHIEIATGTYPFTKDGKKFTGDTVRLIFVETNGGTDNKLYTKFDLDTLQDLSMAMLSGKEVSFDNAVYTGKKNKGYCRQS